MNRATSEIDPAMTEKMIDWSNLPSDIVNLVAERVATNLDDYINFRGVCPSWRSATVGPRHVKFRPQLPWLLLGATNANPLPFVSISDSEARFLPLPEATGKEILFSSDGWLVMQESPTKISLLNPLTSMLIHLPPLPPCEDTEDEGEDIRMRAIAISSSSANFTIMAIIGQTSRLIGLRSGSSAWTLVSIIPIFEDVMYHKGSFYATTTWGHVLVFNAELKRVMLDLIPVRPFVSPWRLVESSPWRLVESSGEILVVQKRLALFPARTIGFLIYKLNSLEGSLQFAEVHNLGGRMIFLGSYGRAVSFPTKDYPRSMGHRIYCSEENIWVSGQNWKYKSGAFRPLAIGFCISSSTEKRCWTSFSGTTTWHVPRLC